MALILNAFTNPANTVITADTGAPPGSLPVPAVLVAKDAEMPVINGSVDYIFSPFDGPGSTVTLVSTFTIPGGLLPTFTIGLPITAFFAYAADLTATSSATLRVITLLGTTTFPLFAGVSNGGNEQNVAIGSGDALVLATLGTIVDIQVIVTTTVTAPLAEPYPIGAEGSYLGNLTVRALAVV